ncbi:MAG: hypothetical protein ACE365_06445 [Gammaproteobacteria bacterium]
MMGIEKIKQDVDKSMKEFSTYLEELGNIDMKVEATKSASNDTHVKFEVSKVNEWTDRCIDSLKTIVENIELSPINQAISAYGCACIIGESLGTEQPKDFELLKQKLRNHLNDKLDKQRLKIIEDLETQATQLVSANNTVAFKKRV